MSYAEIMLERAKERGSLSDIVFRLGGSGRKLPFPLDKVYVSLESTAEEGELLLGDDDGLCTKESLTASVLVSERESAEKCREYAKRVCMELMRLDSDKRIISVAAGKCVYDEAAAGRRTVIVFGLRPVRRSGGD